MKQLLYWFCLVLFVSLCLGCNKVSYDYITIKSSKFTALIDSIKIKVPYRTGEYVVSMPDNSYAVARSIKYLRDTLKLHYKSTCPCSDRLQLWTGVRVQLAPDNGSPDRPSGPSGSDSTLGIVPNVLVLDSLDIVLPNFDGPGVNASPFVQPNESSASNSVVLAIVDSGIDATQTTVNSDNYSYLFKNNYHKISYPYYLCPKAIIKGIPQSTSRVKEGFYGMNILRLRAAVSNQIDNQSSQTLGINNDTDARSNPIDIDGHGTFINGIITGRAVVFTNNFGLIDRNNYYIGETDRVRLKLLHVKFVEKRGEDASLFDALCGVHYALNKEAKVINASWRALSGGDGNLRDGLMRRVFRPTLEDIQQSNVMLIAAAGNDGLKTPVTDLSGGAVKAWPASFSRGMFENNVITVGAWGVDSTKIAYFSNESKFVDIYAPGANIGSITQGGYNTKGQGTSYAAPYVARLAAVLWGLYPNLSPAELKERIKRNASPLTDTPSVNLKMVDHNSAVNDTGPQRHDRQ